MANNGNKKVNKQPDSVRRDIIVVAVVLIIIAVYIFVECYSALHVEVETITAVTSTVYDRIETKALVVRDEHIITGVSGVSSACVGDGEKVKVGGNIAMQFSSEEDARNYSLLQDLHSELDYYNELESKSAGIATDVEAIDKDILSDVNAYIRNANISTADKLSNYTDDLNDKLTRRQMIIGEKIDFSIVKGELESKINSINTDGCRPIGTVTTQESGIFSSYSDGLEDKFDYGNIADITADTLRSYMDAITGNENHSNALGKLITSYKWYMCCIVSSDAVKGIKNGESLDVAVKDSDEIIRCTVVTGAEPDLGVNETVLVLTSSRMDSEITSMRLEDIEIRYNTYTGFKVPASAVHVDEEGNKCVYALVANQVAQRYGKVIYSTKDYVVFDADAEGENSIRYYDRIITKGKDLRDGKVYT